MTLVGILPWPVLVSGWLMFIPVFFSYHLAEVIHAGAEIVAWPTWCCFYLLNTGYSVINLFPMSVLQLSWLFLIPLLTNFGGINMVLVSGQCQSDQQSLLLQMKSSLIFNSSTSFRMVQWNQGTDCCTWSGVDCDEAARVIDLDLSMESISAGIDNSSPLFSLKYLQSLNLAFNMFNATEVPSGLGNLTNLMYLNISHAGFAGQIPVEISGMTSLVTLDLSSFPSFLVGDPILKLENPKLSVLVQRLKELRELYLDGINISAHGNEWCQALSSSLPNLQVLSLSGCFLSGPIGPSLLNLRSLSVIRLDMNDLYSPVPEFLADFSNLTSLYLSGCGLHGAFPEKILQLPTLETLDLSYNELLQGSLPDFPQNLSFETLILSETNFSGTLPDSIRNLKNLSRIDVHLCNFTGPIPTSMPNLSQLVYLDLSFNHFSGPIPSLHMSRNLAYLDISHNDFSGVISSTGWEQLLNLFHVDLRYNNISGSIPQSLFSLPLLQKLLLASNHFEAKVPEFSNASASVLDTLDVRGNRLEGPISISVFELENLRILDLSFNKFNGTVQLDTIERLHNLARLDLLYNSLAVNTSSGDYSFLPQFSTLNLASCKLRVIPNLKNQSQLRHLDLSDNQISGEIPNWIWGIDNGGLEHLNLSHNLLSSLQRPFNISDFSLITVIDLHSNQLQGNILYPPPFAAYVDYSSNNFTSSIPDDVGNFMPFATFFSLSNNSLTGVIPESVCDATGLLVLDLSNNNLRGRIPTCLTEISGTLAVLDLRRNNLSGPLSGTFPGNCALETLSLNGNQLDGTVPKSLANCARLKLLDLGNNKISDTFPFWLESISSLHVLVLRSNRFYGTISCPEKNGSWPMLQIADLAFNNFSGRLPQKCLKTWKAMMFDEDLAQSRLKHLHFELNPFSLFYFQDAVTVTSKGLEMELLKIPTIFTSIDLSSNNFEGPLPEEIGLFKSLYVLNLSHNALTGSIPSLIGNLREIESLDLSMNNLTGTIPAQLASLNFLSVLNLSYNHLVGRIPKSTQLQSFLPNSFEGNDRLCGLPLSNDCPTNSGRALPSAQASTDEIDWFFIAMAIGFAVGFGSVVAPLMFSRKVNKWYNNLINRFINCRFCV